MGDSLSRSRLAATCRFRALAACALACLAPGVPAATQDATRGAPGARGASGSVFLYEESSGSRILYREEKGGILLPASSMVAGSRREEMPPVEPAKGGEAAPRRPQAARAVPTSGVAAKP